MEELAVNTNGESDGAEERTVDIYESSDIYSGHAAVTQSALNSVSVNFGFYCTSACVCNEHLPHSLPDLSTIADHFCKDGCKLFSNSFYYISSDKMNWKGSRQDCRNRGADLVVVNNEGEQAFINSFRRIFWIGLTDKEEEGTWKWVDGLILNSTGFWKTGEPTGKFQGKEEDCVETFFHAMISSWNDVDCAIQRHWICEKRIDF
uniref:C-type lectin domain-containing protein n=1 Tax=Sander lucioperca TaxID=283035 RepID=A0A8C9YAS4_SANLU